MKLPNQYWLWVGMASLKWLSARTLGASLVRRLPWPAVRGMGVRKIQTLPWMDVPRLIYGWKQISTFLATEKLSDPAMHAGAIMRGTILRATSKVLHTGWCTKPWDKTSISLVSAFGMALLLSAARLVCMGSTGKSTYRYDTFQQ